MSTAFNYSEWMYIDVILLTASTHQHICAFFYRRMLFLPQRRFSATKLPPADQQKLIQLIRDSEDGAVKPDEPWQRTEATLLFVHYNESSTCWRSKKKTKTLHSGEQTGYHPEIQTNVRLKPQTLTSDLLEIKKISGEKDICQQKWGKIVKLFIFQSQAWD